MVERMGSLNDLMWIMFRYSRSGEQVLVLPAKRPGRSPENLLKNFQSLVRQFIRSENLKSQCVNLDRVGRSER